MPLPSKSWHVQEPIRRTRDVSSRPCRGPSARPIVSRSPVVARHLTVATADISTDAGARSGLAVARLRWTSHVVAAYDTASRQGARTSHVVIGRSTTALTECVVAVGARLDNVGDRRSQVL